MFRMTSGLAGLMLLAGLQMAVAAEGDPVAGRALAEKSCVRCHDIEPGGAFKTYPPSFASIAVYRSPELITERIWWPSNHANMPQGQWLLSYQDVMDLTAYITSLDKK